MNHVFINPARHVCLCKVGGGVGGGGGVNFWGVENPLSKVSAGTYRIKILSLVPSVTLYIMVPP